MTFTEGPKTLVLTKHARDRYHEAYPGCPASDGTIKAALHAAERIAPDVVWALTQRHGEADDRDSFWISTDYRGIFVLMEHPQHFYIQTFLRLSPSQQHIARGGKAADLASPAPAVSTRPDTATYILECHSLLGSLNKGEVFSPRTCKKLLNRILELATYLDTKDPVP